MASDMNFDGPLAELEHVLAAQPTLERRAAKGRSREHGMQQSAPEAEEAVALAQNFVQNRIFKINKIIKTHKMSSTHIQDIKHI